MKELVILDLDGVVICGQSQQIFLNYLFKKKILGLLFFLKLNCWFVLYKIGFLKSPQNVMNYAFSFLKGKNVDFINNIVEDFFNKELKNFIFPEIIDIINKHKIENRELLLISNAIDLIANKVADFLDIEHRISTKLETSGDNFTGRILGSIVYGKNKTNFMKDFIKRKSLNLNNSYAYADHISDLYLLLEVANPCAVNPDRPLLCEAQKRNWPVLIFNNK